MGGRRWWDRCERLANAEDQLRTSRLGQPKMAHDPWKQGRIGQIKYRANDGQLLVPHCYWGIGLE